MSSRAQIRNHVKTYLAEIVRGTNPNTKRLKSITDALLSSAHRLNEQEGGEAGTCAIYHEVSKHVDLKKFMNSLSEEQLATIRSKALPVAAVSQRTELVGGDREPYSALEIILGILFFPGSLIYFFFLR